MTYHYIRTGYKPINEGHLPAWQIKLCFETCTKEVQQRLEQFLLDLSQESITFDFDDNQVEVRRE